VAHPEQTKTLHPSKKPKKSNKKTATTHVLEVAPESIELTKLGKNAQVERNTISTSKHESTNNSKVFTAQKHVKTTEPTKKSTINVQESEKSNTHNIVAPTVDPDLSAFLRLHATHKLIENDRHRLKPPALDTLSDADEDQFNAFIDGDDADSPTREYNQILLNWIEKGVTALTPLLTSKQKTPKERLAMNSLY
jgi:hypothetical protein